MLTRFNLPQVLQADHTVLAPDEEAAQPLYARYWLHNRGPAALGGLPAVAHLHPHHAVAEPNTQVVLRLTAASDCTDEVLHGKVRLVCPDGWTSDPSELPYMLPPGGHLATDVALTVPPDAQPGLYPIRAELAVTGGDVASLPPSWRQVVEDVCIVSVGEPAESTELLRLISGPEPVDVKAGDATRLAVTVGTDAHAALATWEWMGPSAFGVELRARATVELAFDVAPPVWVEPGEWWALIRVAAAGRLLYSPAVKVMVR